MDGRYPSKQVTSDMLCCAIEYMQQAQHALYRQLITGMIHYHMCCVSYIKNYLVSCTTQELLLLKAACLY